jgi:hypothetical protein
MEELSEFGREYLLLGLRISKYLEEKERLKLPPEEREKAEIDKYAESYFGPQELEQTVLIEKVVSPRNLLKSCKLLQTQLKDQGFEQERLKFIETMLGAMEIKLEIEIGKEFSYLDQVKRLYDITPTLIDDSIFFDARDKVDELYSGKGSLLERSKKVKESQEIPQNKIIPFYELMTDIVRKKTHELFPDLLPEGEQVKFRVIKDKTWSAYNWYLGWYKSRIDINTNIPVRWPTILSLSAHEGYPGHHTEHAVKDNLLYQQQKRFEHSIILINTPEAVICEGIANCALDVLYSRQEAWELGIEILCPNSEESIEILMERQRINQDLKGFSGNLAIHKYVENWSNEELLKYMMQFELWTEEESNERIKFISHPLWRTFIFTYYVGEILIKSKYGDRPSQKGFTTLLTRPILPSDLK